MTTNSQRRIYFDSCVCIEALQKQGDRYENVEPLLQLAASGELTIITSTLAWFETQRYRDPSGTHLTAESCEPTIRHFFTCGLVKLRAIDHRIAKKGRELRSDPDFRSRSQKLDTLHIATALIYDCEYLLTYDGDGKDNKKSMLQHTEKVGGEPLLKILTPEEYNNTEEWFGVAVDRNNNRKTGITAKEL